MAVLFRMAVLMNNLARVGLGVAVALAASWSVACSSSSSSSSSGEVPDGSATFDSGGSSGSSGSSGDIDSGAGTDSGGQTDAGGDFAEPGIGLANFHSAGLDLCVKPKGAADYTAPALYAAEGGIPLGAMGVVRPVPIDAEVKFIPAGVTCTQDGLYPPGVITTKNTPRIIMVVRKEPLDDARKVFMRPTQHVAGKDNVYYARLGRDATFTPTGGAAITIEDDRVNPIDPNLTGTLLLKAPAGDYTTQMKTAAGVSLIIETPTNILLCDLAAPPTGHLAACGGTVRAP